MPLSVGTRLGPYEIVALLGAGGMGEVYRARDIRLERDVAVKVLPPDRSNAAARERFQREARAVAALQHPHICTIHDVGQTEDGQQFLVMELLQGETLQQRLARGPLDLVDAVEVGAALADALAAAHQAGILHRDVKPGNIFLTARGPKLLDFGLAKDVQPAPHGDSQATVTAVVPLTDPGGAIGTLAYMSPEQMRGQPLDARSDLFSLGLVLNEMATGQPPPAPSRLRAGLPPLLAQVMRTALETDRDHRYQTASDMHADLERARRGLDSQPAPASASATGVTRLASSSTAKPRSSDTEMLTALVRRHRIGVAVTAAAVAVVLVGVYGLTREGRNATTPPASARLNRVQVRQLTTSGNTQWPGISPDGRFVAYVQRDGAEYSLWVRQTASDSNVRILEAQPGVIIVAPSVTPDGGFVDFVRRDTRDAGGTFELWRVPFLGGRARRIARDVWSPVGWSPDGRQMAFVRTNLQQGSDALIVAGADGGGERVTAERRRPAGRFFSVSLLFRPLIRPSWSPDGRVIALAGSTIKGDAETSEVVFVDVATGAQRGVPLSIPENAPVHGVAWLDETSLAVNHAADGSAPSQIWRMLYPDGRLERITNDVNRYVGVSVTADRNALATARSEPRMGIWVGDASGGNAAEIVPALPYQLSAAPVAWAGERLVYLANAAGRSAIMSIVPGASTPREIQPDADWLDVTADGRTVVFSTGRDRPGIWKVGLDGGQPVRLASIGGVPAVTPDGRRVVFVSSLSGVQSPWIVSTDGGAPVEIDSQFADGVSISRDGRLLAFSSTGRVVVCELPACGNRRELETRTTLGGGLQFTPDGTALAFIDGPTGANVWVQPLQGGEARQLTQFTDGRRLLGFAWSSDGRRLAMSRSSANSDIVLFSGLTGGAPE